MDIQQHIDNPEIFLAFGFLRNTAENVFLTGKAGTGKTTFLHNLRKSSPKRMVVLAPTGVAAINAGGVTIHSFFQMPFGPWIPGGSAGPVAGGGFKKGLSARFHRFSRKKFNIIRSVDLIVIDEISMVRGRTCLTVSMRY
jgi:GTPase SAR1 family protein